MWNMIQAVVRRLQTDKELEKRLRKNREALERKRTEARIVLPAAVAQGPIFKAGMQA